jgi:hypothetical protein
MATWQFGLSFLSENLVASHGIAAGTRINDNQREELIQLNIERLPSELVDRVSRVLKSGKSWSESIEVFGNIESTCVSFSKEHNIIVEIGARLDLRNISPEILVTILDFASAVKCLLLTDDNKVINPIFSELKSEIKLSPAYRFVKDPRSFIEDIVDAD